MSSWDNRTERWRYSMGLLGRLVVLRGKILEQSGKQNPMHDDLVNIYICTNPDVDTVCGVCRARQYCHRLLPKDPSSDNYAEEAVAALPSTSTSTFLRYSTLISQPLFSELAERIHRLSHVSRSVVCAEVWYACWLGIGFRWR